ncbi:DEHA2G07414p [Debaryomyces hansenii CBS767]|uniref:IMP-specific 5'-nucleotidase 1 n=1 Tax=Debaryomyces hansenii (strain ATCC 36239 / CBS 767 / BCRC 21394 / JCM 1990 / NBRC 0083 / IGC 2968) TaxID=284592 RepID=ISN1_DEBHA|nr:DEHA2G07414p [Debaryomyces hansenii CBS767]Q6BIV1.2 RecName: Full=IMP-specific 5'-nucleotidase 1 [Debaryomyces hansenii CBS767]CAG90331.2 DEHA2G07414p [Debaryomyces hansenii CBS767]|eukprot:XP_461870.2 DEHA2G07414p [Debaryomyces hansenii CBS767]
MTSRYRVEYALKSHRRDEFIEWIKGLLAVPFVLHADVENYDTDFMKHYEDPEAYEDYLLSREYEIALECQNRYKEIFADVEKLVNHAIIIDKLQDKNPTYVDTSRLRKLVPSVGRFFTPLPLTEAFLVEDSRRSISKRRLVSPSFNDVRSILNTAQVLALAKMYQDSDESGSRLKLITFDGDVTLYADGSSLTPDAPVIDKLIKLLSMNLFIGVVTAAGYPGQSGVPQYYERLKGLIDRIRTTPELNDHQRENLLVMGGESNYLFRYDNEFGNLKFIEADEWYLPIMSSWDKLKIDYIMSTTDKHLKHLQKKFKLDDMDKTTIIRKERSIGIIPNPGYRILREHLEEMVLSCSMKLQEILARTARTPVNMEIVNQLDTSQAVSTQNAADDHIKVCAFNGGSDVWVDIGDKSLGVESLQKYLCKDVKYEHKVCPILKSESLHIGDQFASLGANDFKARLSACTVWIASPRETVAILEDLIQHLSNK